MDKKEIRKIVRDLEDRTKNQGNIDWYKGKIEESLWKRNPPITCPNKPITNEYRTNYDKVQWKYHWLVHEGT